MSSTGLSHFLLFFALIVPEKNEELQKRSCAMSVWKKLIKEKIPLKISPRFLFAKWTERPETSTPTEQIKLEVLSEGCCEKAIFPVKLPMKSELSMTMTVFSLKLCIAAALQHSNARFHYSEFGRGKNSETFFLLPFIITQSILRSSNWTLSVLSTDFAFNLKFNVVGWSWVEMRVKERVRNEKL